jgi:hypothetical protein
MPLAEVQLCPDARQGPTISGVQKMEDRPTAVEEQHSRSSIYSKPVKRHLPKLVDMYLFALQVILRCCDGFREHGEYLESLS